MAMETFEALLPAFPAADLVFLQGWGEPLLHPAFWEMAVKARATGAQVDSPPTAVSFTKRTVGPS